MVRFILDDLTVSSDEVAHRVLTNQALHHRDIEAAIGLGLACANLTDTLGLDAKEQSKLADPLVE